MKHTITTRAIVIDTTDNVATALCDISAGEQIELLGASERMGCITSNCAGRKSHSFTADGERPMIIAQDDIPRGHKVAVRPIAPRELIIKYGEAIGRAKCNIRSGEHVHVHNVVGIRGHESEVEAHDAYKRGRPFIEVPDDIPRQFMGYRRENGAVGIRNHVLVIPTVVCANRVAEIIAQQVDGAVCVTHVYGCTFSNSENAFLERIFTNFALNPNVIGVIVVALGCETIDFEAVAHNIASARQCVELIVIQRDGGSDGAINKGISSARAMVDKVRHLAREPVSVSELTIAVECGGSDAFSGLSANPATGIACDIHIALGGTVIFSETAEVIGADHIIATNAIDEVVARKFLDTVKRVERGLSLTDAPEAGAFITRGNIEGGLTTLEEKSLGCIRKAGSSPLMEVVEFGMPPKRKGLVFMDTPGHDIKSITGMVAGSAQLVLFTTGRGTPTGCAIAPVLKIGSNSDVQRRMPANIDVNAGTILDGVESIYEVGVRIYREVIEVASNRLTCAEAWKHSEFALPVEGIISKCRPDG